MYRILLADDEDIFLDYMRQAINWEDFDCEICACCEDGERAWSAVQEKRPDIAFLDISMPRMDGLEVCERIHDEKIGTMVVIMSAHDEFSFACKAIKLDVTDYLLKPFTETELETSLKRVLGKLTKGARREPPVLEKVLTEKGAQRPVRKDRTGSGTADGNAARDLVQEGAVGRSNQRHIEMEQRPQKNEADAAKRKYVRRHGGRNERLVNQIETYIAEHYHEQDLSIDRIAMALQFENSYLRRVYKRSTGATIAQRIDEIRIQRAKALLKEGRLLNREIAEAVGYSDQYYFSRRFKEISGETPTEYRAAGSSQKGID